ncbi:MAG: thioesterase [Lachnospiraceae bacterium]|nr:thioesterase [Lachnospiraceae bacterium]
MYELKSRVRYSEADENGVLSMQGLMNYLQDCCTMQAEDLGIGLSYLKENHIGWMVTSYQVKILGALPSVGDCIVVKTWPYQFRGMLGYRNFTVETEGGEALVLVDSLWILMDIEAKKPIRLPAKMIEAYELSPQLPGEWDLRKKLTLEDKGSESDVFTVAKMHLDTNHHMNNVNYMAAAMACISSRVSVKEMFITYKNAAVLGDEIHCYVADKEDGCTVCLCDCAGDDYCVVECVFG